MSTKNIAVVSNLTSGGSVVYKNNFLLYSKSNVKYTLCPRSFDTSSKKLLKIFKYIKYLYFDLAIDYYRIACRINRDKDIDKIIVFQDSYIKAPYALAFLRKKSIYILHEPPREFYEPSYFHAPRYQDKLFNLFFRTPIKYLDKYLTQKSDVIVSNSKYSGRIINNIYNKKSIIIYPGSKKAAKRSKTLTARQNQCISIGSLLPYKGHEIAIKVISMSRLMPHLIIIGDGSNEDKNRLYKLASDVKVKLEIKNNLSHDELSKEFLRSKIYLNCAYKEPFGLAALESLYYGCLLLTNDLGGTKELEDIFPSNVFVSSDNKDMADKIDLLLTSGKNKFCHNTNLDWKKITNKIINL